MNEAVFQVSDAIAIFNQTLDYATPTIIIEGEVSQFKVNQNKWVFFDLKDDEGTLNCFMSKFSLRVAIEDGMRVRVVAKPNLTKWGRFSLTIQQIKPVGEGDLKKSFELLRKKLTNEGLFAPERKRELPQIPERIGVISSTGAAGYHDFIKIVNERFAGLEISVINTLVQGEKAPDEIIAAIQKFNELETPPEVIVIVRGGGSRDDLVAFDDELLVRAIAASRVPVLVGVGHEIDTTLAELAADKVASTPSNAAEILVPDARGIINYINLTINQTRERCISRLDETMNKIDNKNEQIKQELQHKYNLIEEKFVRLVAILSELNPDRVLQRGYAILHGKIEVGEVLGITTKNRQITAKIIKVDDK